MGCAAVRAVSLLQAKGLRAARSLPEGSGGGAIAVFGTVSCCAHSPPPHKAYAHRRQNSESGRADSRIRGSQARQATRGAAEQGNSGPPQSLGPKHPAIPKSPSLTFKVASDHVISHCPSFGRSCPRLELRAVPSVRLCIRPFHPHLVHPPRSQCCTHLTRALVVAPSRSHHHLRMHYTLSTVRSRHPRLSSPVSHVST